MPTDVTTISTTRSVQDIRAVLDSCLRDARVIPVGPASDEPEAQRPEIAVFAEQSGFLRGVVGVQIVVTDEGPRRTVQVVAHGDTRLRRLWRGARNSFSLEISSELARRVVASIQEPSGVSTS